MTLGIRQECEKLPISFHLHTILENKYENHDRQTHFSCAMAILNPFSFPGLPRLYTAQSMNTRVCVACGNIERLACHTQATLGAYTGWETGKSRSHPAPPTSLIDQWADSGIAILITGSYAEEVTIPWCDSATDTVDYLKANKIVC